MEILKEIRKILVIQTAFIGDAVLTLPMLQYLRKKYPSAKISVISTPVSKPIFNASPSVNHVIALDKRREHKSLWQTMKFAAQLRNEDYDMLISPHRSFRSALIAKFSGISQRVGFDNSSFRSAYNHLVPYNGSHHEVRRNLSLAGMQTDEENWRILPELIPSEEARLKTDKFMYDNQLSGKIVAVAPGSVWATKKYPEESFRLMLKMLTAHDLKVVLIGGEADRENCQRLAGGFESRVISSAGSFSIVESVELLRRCKLLIGNDSAPTHFAMCAHIPAITIYCSTVPRFGFYPYAPDSLSMSYDELKCKPCGIHGLKACPIKSFDCAYKIDPEYVAESALKILG